MQSKSKSPIDRAKMRRGDYTKIAMRSGYDVSHVIRVINGESNNPNGRILRVARELTRGRKAMSR